MFLIKFMINMILMNDFMSLGIHRLWKKNLLNMMNPSTNQKLD